MSERLDLRSGAAVPRVRQEERLPPREPTGLAFRCAVNGRQWRWAKRRRAEQSGEDATCAVLMVSRCEEAVGFRCRVHFIVNIEDATALRSDVHTLPLAAAARPPSFLQAVHVPGRNCSAGRGEMRLRLEAGVRAAVGKKTREKNNKKTAPATKKQPQKTHHHPESGGERGGWR